MVQKLFTSAHLEGFYSMLWWSIGSFFFRLVEVDGDTATSFIFQLLACLVDEEIHGKVKICLKSVERGAIGLGEWKVLSFPD